jgi:hypothetical protein
MTKLMPELRRDTIPEAAFDRRFNPEPPNEAIFSTDIEKDEPIEIETIEIPVVKKMIFKFNEPVKLEFS